MPWTLTYTDPFKARTEGGITSWISALDFIFESCHETYQNAEFQEVLKEDFDLIFVDAIMQDCLSGAIHQKQTPFIVVSTCAPFSLVSEYVG